MSRNGNETAENFISAVSPHSVLESAFMGNIDMTAGDEILSF